MKMLYRVYHAQQDNKKWLILTLCRTKREKTHHFQRILRVILNMQGPFTDAAISNQSLVRPPRLIPA